MEYTLRRMLTVAMAWRYNRDAVREGLMINAVSVGLNCSEIGVNDNACV